MFLKVPGQGIQPLPQQQPKPLQWQRWLLNSLGYQGTPRMKLLSCATILFVNLNALPLPVAWGTKFGFFSVAFRSCKARPLTLPPMSCPLGPNSPSFPLPSNLTAYYFWVKACAFSWHLWCDMIKVTNVPLWFFLSKTYNKQSNHIKNIRQMEGPSRKCPTSIAENHQGHWKQVNLRNCYSPEEPKETWWLNVRWVLGCGAGRGA